ncbi:t-SNARE [Paraphysoderma sedebokerense]|nr:t-SNARE [Paraphysoderma sedebokerense]
MARDRMQELRAAGYNRPQSRYHSSRDRDIEMNDIDYGRNEGFLSSFLDEVAAVDESVKRIRDNVMYIDQLQRRNLDTHRENEQYRNSQELERVTSETKKTMARIKGKIKSLRSQIPTSPATADTAIMNNQLSALQKKYNTVLQEFTDQSYKYSQRIRGKMERQIRIVKPDATEDEIDAMIDSPQGGQVFAQSMLQSSRYSNARSALNEVQNRHEDLVKIEKTILELNELFLNMQNLIEEQSIQINNIEEYVDNTVVNVEKADTEIKQAIEHRKGAIRKSWWLCGCCLILLIIVFIVVFVIPTGPLTHLMPWGPKSSPSSK